MSSKKTKSTKDSKVNKKSPRKKDYQQELVAPDCWINELAETNINDDSWKCSVTIIEEESTDSTVYMEHFNEAAVNGNRLSVKNISKLEIINYIIKNLAGNQPDGSPSPLKLLCSEVFQLVGPEFKNKIPTQLLASLIKYIILEYKELNKTIKEGMEKRKKEFEEYQQSLWQVPVKSISSKGTKSSKLESKSKKLDKVTKVKTGGKPFTMLRKRGEEWKDKTWIDDSPPDGPQLYIAVSTFYDPHLPLELLKLNIPLHAIAKLCFWETGSNTTKSEVASFPNELKDVFQSLQNFRHKSTPHLNSTIRKRLGNENDKNEYSNNEIYRFWKTINILKTELPTALMFKNVMFLHFTPEHFSFQFHIQSFQKEIYKQISYFLYDVHEITKQHSQYLSEMKQRNLYSDEIFDMSNMKIYQSLLDSVPHEIVNIPFLLDAIVNQVCGLEIGADKKETLQVLEETSEQSIPGESNYLTKLLNQLNFKYDLFGDQFKETVFNENAHKNNINTCNIKNVLKHFDDTNITTFHLQEDIAEFVRKRSNHILQVAWNDILLDFFSVYYNDDNILKICSEIIKTAKESNENTLNYYIYILVVNSILNALLIHDCSFYSTLKLKPLEESAHNERENMCEDCVLEVYNVVSSTIRNTVSTLSNNSTISSYKLCNQIVENNLFYIEYMTADVLLQWIQATWYRFNKVETRYCSFTNQVVIVFHNLLSPKSGVFEEKWLGKIKTYVPIRDFVEYILEEEKDWLSQFQSRSTVESSNVDKAVTFYNDKPLNKELLFLFPDQQFISLRSLKYEKILKQQKSGNKVLYTENKSPKTKTVSKHSDSLKKSKRNDKQKEKKISEIKLSGGSFKLETPKENYTFMGYDLGSPMRIQFSGLKKEKILDGCCKITLQTVEKLYGEKSQALTLTISGHSLYYMYRPYYESTLVNPFHLILSSGIVLNFGLNHTNEENKGANSTLGQIPQLFKRTSTKKPSMLINNSDLETELRTNQSITSILGESTGFVESNDLTPNERNNSSFFSNSLKRVHYFEIPLIYDLQISLPNGLHIELAKDRSLFYIRQTFLSRSRLAKSVEQEKHRCYLSNGYIIKFLLNDTLEVLSPNGLIYAVYEIKEEPFRLEREKTIKPTEGTILKPTLSDISVQKNQKIKENYQGSSKSSKVKTVQKYDKKSTDSQTPTINTEKTHVKELEKNTNLINISHFECTTSDGKRFRVENNIVTEDLKDLYINQTANVAENCIDSERTDGVSTKHLADGSLLVQFKDGSRITSTPLEAGEVFCEWSSEELNRWFSDSLETMVETAELKIEPSLSKRSDNSHTEKRLSSRKIENALAASVNFHKSNIIPSELLPNENEEELKMSVLEESKTIKSDLEVIISKTSFGTLITSKTDQKSLKRRPLYHEDGFVVYHNSYLMEHPNYGSVYYNVSSFEVELKLPLNTKITLKNDGCYEAYFDHASLTVDSDEIYFGKINESGDFERTAIINNSAANNKNPVNWSNHFNRLNSLPLSVDEFCQSTGIRSLLKGTVIKTEIKSGLLLYCVDAKINEIIVDYDFNIYELPATKDNNLISEDSFTSMVVNENLSGFRLVSDVEVKSHIQLVTEKHGLLQKTNNAWKSLLTAIPHITNESEKWLMKYQKNLMEKSKILFQTSTYGKRESWIQPFVEKEENDQDLVGYKAVIVRLLHKIPDTEKILDKLKVAVQNYNKNTCNNNQLRIFLDEPGVDFISLDELIKNPKLLCKIVKDENTKKDIEKDQFRRDMKYNFLRSLINKAIIKARNIRRKNKEEEFKSALRRKEIPPYHFSGFGYVHSILDEVFENATRNCLSINLSTSSCEKVNYIIDELLSLVSKAKLGSTAEEFDDNSMKETQSIGIKSIISSIFRNLRKLTQDINNQTFIKDIMEKPLQLVTPDDIDFITKMFGSGDCPILQDEEFILQDVLDARLQLSNYFQNLRSMLEYYRGIYPAPSPIS